jgi:hypothetical protein
MGWPRQGSGSIGMACVGADCAQAAFRMNGRVSAFRARRGVNCGMPDGAIGRGWQRLEYHLGGSDWRIQTRKTDDDFN